MGRITSTRRATVVSVAVVAAAAIAAPTVAAGVGRSTPTSTTTVAGPTATDEVTAAAMPLRTAELVVEDGANPEPAPEATAGPEQAPAVDEDEPEPSDPDVTEPIAPTDETDPVDPVDLGTPDDPGTPDEPGDVDDTWGYLDNWRDNFFGDWEPDELAELADSTAPVLSWRAVPHAETYTAADLRWALTDENEVGESITFVQLDDGPAEAWGDERARFDDLADGAHTVTVRAVDQSGNWAEPIVHAWTQLGAPVAAPRVTLAPVTVGADSATFSWVVDNPSATVWYALDDDAPRVATGTTLTVTGLAGGPHVLRVHAGVHHTDEIGSVYVDGRTAAFTWLTGGGTWPEDWLPADPFGAGWRG